MTIREILKENNMSVYKLSKASAVPYATCNDIVNGKAQLENCSAATVYKIAKTLNVTMESILAPLRERKPESKQQEPAKKSKTRNDSGR